MEPTRISTPIFRETAEELCTGTTVLLSGIIYTARDAAHTRFIKLLRTGTPLPVDLTDQVLYYTGPTPAREGSPIGSAGPTTSSRMDSFTPELILKTGLRGMIGKGNRNREVVDSIMLNSCVYFTATGGAGALLSQCIRSAVPVCYEDLGPEAVYKLEVVDMPLIVAIDTSGENLFETGPAEYLESL